MLPVVCVVWLWRRQSAALAATCVAILAAHLVADTIVNASHHHVQALAVATMEPGFGYKESTFHRVIPQVSPHPHPYPHPSPSPHPHPHPNPNPNLPPRHSAVHVPSRRGRGRVRVEVRGRSLPSTTSSRRRTPHSVLHHIAYCSSTQRAQRPRTAHARCLRCLPYPCPRRLSLCGPAAQFMCQGGDFTAHNGTGGTP